LLDYWENNGPQPSATAARDALMEIADDLKLENCIYHPDVIDAMFRQVYDQETRPYQVQSIPGEVLITDFDMGVPGEAYHDVQVANYRVSTGTFTAWNNGWVYRNDGVDLETSQDPQNSNGVHAGWLDNGEWMQYSVDVATEAVYDVEIRVASTGTEGRFHLQAGTADISGVRFVPSTGDWQTFQTITVPDVIMSPSDDKLRFFVDQGGFNVGHMNFIQKGPTTDLLTEFVSAITLDDNTVQLNLNKPLGGPLPASPADFQLFVNGNGINVSSTTLDTDNSRIITFNVGTTFKSSDEIRISYAGNQIQATDGTSLQSFTLEEVQNTVAIIHAIPGKVQAEDFFEQSGIQLENTSDTGGGQNIGFLDNGDYADYYINVDQAGLYNVDYRTAALSEEGGVRLDLISPTGQATELHSATFASTGGWQTWATTRKQATLPTGLHQIRLTITAPLFNINWLEFIFESASSIEVDDLIQGFSVFPNPSQEQFEISARLAHPMGHQIEVYNLQGQRVHSVAFSPSQQVAVIVSPHGWAAGPYLVRLQLKNGQAITRKVMWQGKD
ncbi:MAG: carbohydrate-binding protein, partial [Bacteroidota bacterium]